MQVPKEQRKEIIEAFVTLGGRVIDNDGLFIVMPNATDAALKRIPKVPFDVDLDLSGTKVTDVGLKTVRNKLQGLVR